MTKYSDTTEKLRSSLYKLASGQRLPSIRALMMRFQVSQVTIDRCLRDLEKTGEVIHKTGQGYYRQVMSEAVHHKVAFCFCYRPERMSNPLYGAILGEFIRLSEEKKYETSLMAIDESQGLESFRHKLEGKTIETCVMLGSSRQTSLYALKDFGIRSVQLYPNYMPEFGEAVIIGNADIMHLAFSHLTGLGHKRISMLHGQNYDNTYMLDQEERMEAFYNELSLHGLPSTARSMVYGGFDSETGYQAAMQLLNTAAELRPTAIIANDYNAAGVYKAARELSISIPGELSVIGIDNLPLCNGLSPMLTSVDIKWDSALNTITQFIDAPQAESKIARVPVQLIERKSTAPAP